jgi:hypothetical protein
MMAFQFLACFILLCGKAAIAQVVRVDHRRDCRNGIVDRHIDFVDRIGRLGQSGRHVLICAET